MRMFLIAGNCQMIISLFCPTRLTCLILSGFLLKKYSVTEKSVGRTGVNTFMNLTNISYEISSSVTLYVQ